MDPFSASAVREAYDTVAADYEKAFGDDLAQLPLDREMLDAALAAATGPGWVLEAGCGPGPAAGYLAGRAARLLGIDLSGAMLNVAGARTAGLLLAQADIRHLPLRDASCRLVIAYYSLQHLPRADLGSAMAEFRRVLAGEGRLVVATHLGVGEAHIDEFLGHRVRTFAGAYHRRDEIVGLLASAGFEVELERQRGPLPHETNSQRIYVLARRTSDLVE